MDSQLQYEDTNLLPSRFDKSKIYGYKEPLRTNNRTRSMEMKMEDIMGLLCHISSDLKITVKYSKRGAALAWTGTFVGGLLGGPIGLVAGGAVGLTVAYVLLRRKFKSVPQILSELTPAQKKQICDSVYAIVRNLHWTDAKDLVKIVTEDSTLEKKVEKVLTGFLNKHVK